MTSRNRADSTWSRFERSGSLNDLEEAISAAREAVDLVPDDHRDRAAILSNLGSALRARFERTGSISDLEEALASTRQALAASTVDDLRRPAILNNLGTMLSEAGRVSEALAVAQEAVAIRRELAARNPDANGSDLAGALSNLAGLYLSAGDVSRAIPLYQQTLADMLRVLGPDHPNSLITRGNLASAYSSAGDAARAAAMFEDLLADSLRILGPDHPHTLITRGNLARWQARGGDPAGAATASEELLPDLLRVLGPDHPDTLTTRNNLATWRGKAGDPAGAAAALKELLPDLLRVLGPDHPDTRATRRGLAFWQDAAAPKVQATSPTTATSSSQSHADESGRSLTGSANNTEAVADLRISIADDDADDGVLTGLYQWLVRDPDLADQCRIYLVPAPTMPVLSTSGAIDVVLANVTALGSLITAVLAYRDARHHMAMPTVRLERNGVIVTIESGSSVSSQQVIAQLGRRR